MTNPAPKKTLVKVLSAKLGLAPTLNEPSRGAALKHRNMVANPGSHAALLRRLAGGKDKSDANANSC
jgi:hypothetical protein